ncbi:cytochrome P450 oxidoreductase [Fusarium austroafricanum]|uniref:Cytochrome P450 oxidoreductase n=1 Tax=Fusarium austroafricanum TaxID=2364996 RepID=A0A8H4KLR1_9HYPO|nr:cytochrome P450 oxidoreductase [Fusarium austroafricanum]
MADSTWSAFRGAMSSLTARDYAVVVISSWFAFKLLQALYNISPLHPLHKVPGPKLAAATYIPEFYHDVILFGRYTHAIKKMHEKYGPIVRINPHETHCADMAFSDEIYAAGGRKRNKPAHQVAGSGAGTANAFGTIDHDLHRVRRAPVARFFSRAMIARLEEEIHDLVQTLCNKLLAENNNAKNRGPFDVAHAYSCFTSDAISSYCFGEAFGLLSQDDWQPNFREATLAVLKPVFVFRFFPFLVASVKLAKHLVPFLPTDTALLVRTLQIDIPARVEKTKSDLHAGIHYDRPTVFADLLQSEFEEKEKNTVRLAEEAVAVVNAGTETTSWTLAVITYFLLSQPETLKKLRDELSQAVEDPCHLPSWTELEHLPYLGAVINEGLRLGYGVSSRSARVPTTEDLVYRGEFNKKPMTLVIPRGYAIGMSAAIAHHDEANFPDSYSFIPERWLNEDNKPRKDLERSMIAFSKGSRGCLGKNLALCELHLSLTALALRVMPHMRLFETTERDIAYDHDMFVPMTEKGSKGVRVTIDKRFTEGPGGEFIYEPDATLKYHLSGGEPMLYAGSSRGIPNRARPENDKGVDGYHSPIILTDNKLAYFQRKANQEKPPSFSKEIKPLIFREREYVYYKMLLTQRGQDLTGFRHLALSHPYTPVPQHQLEQVGISKDDRESWEHSLRPRIPETMEYRNYQQWIILHLEEDSRQLALGNRDGLHAAARDVLRDICNSILLAIDHDGISGHSRKHGIDASFTRDSNV